jgi:hypothetical protein
MGLRKWYIGKVVQLKWNRQGKVELICAKKFPAKTEGLEKARQKLMHQNL